ncbi:glycoside hydrolase family 9 protein [Xanthomonas sp. 3058]|uniref:glycoside hydrolase family 9 protein n=1 Tax=Xanthomonas sp. 3058 TaxID=3035314 RepID=UPI001614A97C|nr:glycoside hydrolase family 9 protein [Xanthomonas sp. 3058]MBB5864921.1 endoglucanase [Xanthomonas sp. 3058]
MNARPLLLTVFLSLSSVIASADAADAIYLNQVGYLPTAGKMAVIGGAGNAARFTVQDARGLTVLEGSLQPSATWSPAAMPARVADFSALRSPGSYRVQVDGLPLSDPFSIDAAAYRPLLDAALKAYYFNRASTALPQQFAGSYARAAGHPDTTVLVHASAASATRPEGSSIAAPKGWYDAGDYNKYIVNSGIATYTLLAAYEHHPALFQAQALQIPDQAPGVPGILQETWWNLQWMLAMQDPADGGVYHKLTNKQFDYKLMPAQATKPRYVVTKTTAAALDFAAVMAAASRIYAPYEAQYPGASARMLTAARAAWGWTRQNSIKLYRQPADIVTGEYGDTQLNDEFAWAAAELYIATGEDAFYDAMIARNVSASVPSWGNVAGLAWMSLATHRAQLTAHADQARIASEVTALSERLAERWQTSPWRVSMLNGDFVWGSNSVALNQAMMLLQGYRLSPQRRYLDAAQAQLDYVLGRNPLGMSFVTGTGARAPLRIHQNISMADGVAAPVPGLLVGGPQPGRQDAADCSVAYRSTLPALSYLDHECSYASNEVAINWNAPLVYVTAALQVYTR